MLGPWGKGRLPHTKEKETCTKEVDFESGLEKEQKTIKAKNDRLGKHPQQGDIIEEMWKEENPCIPRAPRMDDQVHLPSGARGPLGTSHDLKTAAFVPQVEDQTLLHSELPLSGASLVYEVTRPHSYCLCLVYE